MALFERAQNSRITVEAAVDEVTDHVLGRRFGRTIVEERFLEDVLLRLKGFHRIVEFLTLRRQNLPTLLVGEDRRIARRQLQFALLDRIGATALEDVELHRLAGRELEDAEHRVRNLRIRAILRVVLAADRRDVTRRTLVHHPAHRVEIVDAPVADLTGEVRMPAEVVRRGRVLVGTIRPRPEPLVPIEPFRRITRRTLAEPVREDVRDTRGAARAERAVLARINRLLEFPIGVVSAAVEAHGHNLIGILLRVDHRAALGNRRRQRLLAIDILARLDCVNRHDRMPVVRRRNADGIDVLVGKELPVVGIEIDLSGLDHLDKLRLLRLDLSLLVPKRRDASLEAPLEELRIEVVEVAFKERLVDVAERGHLDLRILHEDVKKLGAAVADTDEAHADLLLRARLQDVRHRHRTRRHCTILDEFSPFHDDTTVPFLDSVDIIEVLTYRERKENLSFWAM